MSSHDVRLRFLVIIARNCVTVNFKSLASSSIFFQILAVTLIEHSQFFFESPRLIFMRMTLIFTFHISLNSRESLSHLLISFFFDLSSPCALLIQSRLRSGRFFFSRLQQAHAFVVLCYNCLFEYQRIPEYFL